STTQGEDIEIDKYDLILPKPKRWVVRAFNMARWDRVAFFTNLVNYLATGETISAIFNNEILPQFRQSSAGIHFLSSSLAETSVAIFGKYEGQQIFSSEDEWQ